MYSIMLYVKYVVNRFGVKEHKPLICND